MVKRVALLVLVGSGLALAVPTVTQAGGKTQIANTELKSVTSVRSQSVQGTNNKVQAGGINVKKGTQMFNTKVKSTTVVGRQKVQGTGNSVQTGGVNIGDGPNTNSAYQRGR
jgi:hypothetical protein